MSDSRPIDEAALDRRLAEARAAADAEVVRAEASRTAGTAMGIGFRIGIELVVGVCIGTGGGYALDRWLHTAPWLMIVGLIVGFAAGLRNVFRSADEYGKKWDAADAADRADKTDGK
ncbi:AtpZ/AtpI family protein [Glacieibacterium sp.]|uniref:AtpZ/AtpI family protein n=1 Tax=Glacieibacterium sp. TaxID=2860237 RepID=UPI003B00DA64